MPLDRLSSQPLYRESFKKCDKILDQRIQEFAQADSSERGVLQRRASEQVGKDLVRDFEVYYKKTKYTDIDLLIANLKKEKLDDIAIYTITQLMHQGAIAPVTTYIWSNSVAKAGIDKCTKVAGSKQGDKNQIYLSDKGQFVTIATRHNVKTTDLDDTVLSSVHHDHTIQYDLQNQIVTIKNKESWGAWIRRIFETYLPTFFKREPEGLKPTIANKEPPVGIPTAS